MMAFFHQLQLLLWKNGLGIIRRPVWSLTLIVWPIVIFIIIAVTRYQFPPVLRQTCYVGPRNLPSTGFFPFLETLMCNTDSDCHNTSRLPHTRLSSRPKRSTQQSENSPLASIIQGRELMQYANSENDPTVLLNSLYNMIGSPSNTVIRLNHTRTGDQPMVNLTESAAMLKSVICTIALPLIQTPPPDHVATAFVTFCRSNNTAFEVFINTMDQVLIELMTSQPDELAKLAEKAVKVFDQLQKETSLWEGFLSFPSIFNPGSPDQLLTNLEKLLANLQKLLTIVEYNFPDIKNVTSFVHPIFVAEIRTMEYMRNWPGKEVSIRFGDVLTSNESLWQMVGDIEIPLDKAILLAFDTKMAHDFFCNNSSGAMWVAACATGSLERLLGLISPNKMAQQIILAWSKSVAHHDLIFVKGMLHSLMGILEGSSGTTRAARSIDAQPQNTEEELFLEAGKVVMEFLKFSPEGYATVQDILRVAFLSMKTGSQAIDTVEGMMENVVKDVKIIKMIVQTLMANQSQTTIWINQALHSVIEIIEKTLSDDPVTCDTVLDELEWLFFNNTIKRDVVQSFLCGNTTTTEQALLKDWIPLMNDAEDLYGAFMGHINDNVTLPMILSEWHTLSNKRLGFGQFVQKIQQEWSGEYWMDWISENSSANHLSSSLQQSVWLFIMKLGQKLEQSPLWPQAKNYFHMTLWILNSTDTTQPNCKMNTTTIGIECEIDFDWYRFSHALTALLTPTEEFFISCLKRSVHVLQHVYGDFYKCLTNSSLDNAIQGGDALSAFLINMLNKVDDFARNLTTLPNQNFSNPQVMVPLYANLLQSIGLAPLLPLITHNGTVNVSQVLEAASKLGRLNQAIFTFNESDPTMKELEKYILHFLSLESNISLSLYYDMSQRMLTYYSYFSQDDVAKFMQVIQPFTNQTSSGIVEAILKSLEVLKTIMDPQSDPTHVILGYIQQLQQFLVSVLHVQRIEQFVLPIGQLSPVQVTDLHLLTDIFNLLTPEMIMNLTHAGPVTAQHIIIQKFIQTLPSQVRNESAEFLDEFVALQSKLSQCTSEQDCLTGISEMLNFLDQILDMALSANGNVTINIASTKMYMGSKQFMPVASAFFSLTLKPNDAAYVKTVQDTLQFIAVLLNHPNITLTNAQEALKQSNLTIEELNSLVMWLGAKDLNDLFEKVYKLTKAQKCFEQTSPVSVAHCAVSMINSISGLLMHLPSLQNHTAILSAIPSIVNQTVADMINTNFTSNPQNAVAEILKATLASVKMTLQLYNMSTPEIQNELEVLKSLIQLIRNPEALKYLNVTQNELLTGRPELKMLLWYLKRLENVTTSSSISTLLHPFFSITQMQVTLQLAQMDLNQFVSEEVWNLTKNLEYPIDAEGIVKISNATTVIIQHVLNFVFDSLKTQDAQAAIFGIDPPINMTFVNATMLQINNYIKLLQQWVIEANFGAWGNLNYTNVVENDIYRLIQSTLNFFKADRQGYIRAVGNITKALDNALVLALQPNGFQSEQFSEALQEAVQCTMNLLIQINGPLPLSIQQSVLSVIKSTVWLAVHPNASYAISLNATRHILQNLQFLVSQIFPQEVAQYPVGALNIILTYFESVTTVNGPDSVNQLILNEMKTIENLLPPDSTAHMYISTIINITTTILQPVHGNQSLLSLIPSEENLPYIFAEARKILNMLCPLFMGESCKPLNASSLEGFASVPHALQMLMMGQASNETWREPLSIEQSIQSVIETTVWLAVHRNASYAMSLNATLNILQNLKFLVSHIVPQEWSHYPVGALEMITTYFKSVASVSGPDGLNHLILNEMKTLESLLPPNDTAKMYISIIINITKTILQHPVQGNQSLLSLDLSEENIPYIVAEAGKILNMLCPLFMGESCKSLNASLLEDLGNLPLVLQRLMMGQASNETWIEPLSIEQSVLTVIKTTVWLAVHRNASYAMSLNATLNILQNLKFLVSHIVPQEWSHYPVGALEMITTYFESVATVNGPDSLNQLILNEMKTLESLFLPNDTAKMYISILINITKTILQHPVQGNRSLLSLIQSEENIPYIIAEAGKILNMLCPLFMGESCKSVNASLLEDLAYLPLVLQRLMMGQASNETWREPLSIEQSVLTVIKTTAWLAVHRNASYAMSLNATLNILQNLKFLVSHIVPQEWSHYAVGALEMITTYFESVATVNGPDSLNRLILNEMKTLESLLPPNDTAKMYISIIINITKTILQHPVQGNQSLLSLIQSEENIPYIVAEAGKILNVLCPLFMGESCKFLNASLLEDLANLPLVLQRLMMGQASNETWREPLNIDQSVQAVLESTLWLAVHRNASYAMSLNATLNILQNLKFLISHIVPQEWSLYPVGALEIITTYFESVATLSGPDSVNHLILNEMKTLESLFPPNDTAKMYISIVINITKTILQHPVQGNQSLWSLDPSEENIPYIVAEVGKLLNMLCPLVMGDSCKPLNASSLEGFADLSHVLEKLMTGQASDGTWKKLEEFVGVLMSFIKPEVSDDDIGCFVEMFEKSIGYQLKNTEAETDFLFSLQRPVLTLISNLTRSLNSSHFNMSEVTERLEEAIEQTIKKSEETNGTMTCQEIMKIWEPVTDAAGLGPSFMVMWCNINLQPVIDGYVNEISQHSQQNWTCTEKRPMNVQAAAARMAMTLRSLYNTEIKQSNVTDQFIQAVYMRFSALVQQPLTPEAKLSLVKQLQEWQIQNSLKSIELLSKELENEFPSFKPYMNAVKKMVTHVLQNQTMEESGDIFTEAAMILLSSVNVPKDDISQIISGNFSTSASIKMALKVMKTMIDMKIFGDNPSLYHMLDQLLASNDTRMAMHKVAEIASWFASTEETGINMTLTKIQELFGSVMSILTNVTNDLPPYLHLLHNLINDAISFVQHLLTFGSIPMRNHYNLRHQPMLSHNDSKVRSRREAPYMPVSLPKRTPMDDFIDLFFIDYHTLGSGLAVEPSPYEVLETFHIFFANPDLEIVLKGATKDLGWGLEISKEDTIDAVLGVATLLTLPEMDYTSSDLWESVINLLPDSIPYASMLKNITQAIARESQENLQLMQETLDTVHELLQTAPTDPQLLEHLKQLRKQVCHLENADSVQILMNSLSLEPGLLCDGIVPGLHILAEGLLFNMSTLLHDAFEVFVGEPTLYNIQTDWTSVLGLNISNLSALNFTTAAPAVTIGEMVRNRTAFMRDLQRFGFDLEAVVLLTQAALPDNNLQILSWLINLRKCDSEDLNNMGVGEKALYNSFCAMDAKQWYRFTLLMAQHLNIEKFIYRMVLPNEIQSLIQTMLQMAMTIIKMMKGMLPAVRQLEEYLISMDAFSHTANNEFHQLTRKRRTTVSSGATFVTISRALCSKGILALFGVAKNPHVSMSPPTFDNNPKREEMIERFKIPHDATPFCTNMYLDMVNTTGGAIAWAFLKPMLMGKILFTPDTPQTRAIMNKANSTLQQLADLRHYSQDWIQSSSYIVKSSEMLTQTLPLLQNSLGNSFVKNFIEMQTGINVDSMQETLNTFSNMTLLLEKNKDLLGQITTLSTLMVDLSSCITFDRYQGYDSEDELNKDAQNLAKNRNLYASVIFKLPKDTDSSRKRRSASGQFTLPPKVNYTIRMHMDNLMRTDRTREPFFSKDTHISAGQTLRYNRGFIYLQETIDRAIIDIQANRTVTDTAVQIQPFPYPCHHRDEYLEAISFVFPLLLMIAWVLFVADFVKKLVHEREMKLHEYMKMMGVNPLSHFFAWFLESAFFLVITISILTLVLKYGNILPNSNGLLLFLYLCDYGLSILAFSFLISTFFDKTYIAALSGSLLYVLAFFPFIAVMALEARFSFSVKSLLGLFSPTAFSYASQYVARYETQGEGIQWSNSYSSPIAGDTASFGWLCWLMLIDTFLYFIIGAYIRTVFPGKSGIPSPWYFPFKASFWKALCGFKKSKNTGRGLFLTNIMQTQPPVFPDSNGKGKGKGDLSSKASENFSDLPVGVALHGLTKVYGQKAAIENLNVAFYEGHVTSLLGHNGAGKTTTMSILTGLFPPSSGTVEVYGKDMQADLEDIRKELGVVMQYDVLFDHMTAKEHLLLYGQIKAPHWSKRELQEHVNTILAETGMYAHRHKRVGTLSGGMRRKLSISIAFIGGSRLVVLDEPTTGVDPCSRRSIWDIVIQHKKGRTIIMSTHHLDEAEVLSDRVAFLERGGLKCCGSPYYLKDQLGQGYKLTLTKKMQNGESKKIDNAELKAFVQAHVPEARLKEAQGSDLVYLLPPFTSNNASSYRSLLTALDSNLDALQLGCYGISDTTLEEVFLHLTQCSSDAAGDELPTISETVSDTDSIDSYPESEENNYSDTDCFTGTPKVSGMKLAWQQMTAILIKRFHHSRRDWKGLLSQILLPVLFVLFAMGLGTIKSDLRHYPDLELTPALYNIGPSYSFFRNPNSSRLADAMLTYPGLDNACLQKPNDKICSGRSGAWTMANGTKTFSTCKCVHEKQVCGEGGYVPPHKQIPSSQIVYNVTDLNVENYLVGTADDYIRNRYGGYDFGLPLPQNLKMDVKAVPSNRTLSKVWFNPEGHHTMPAYLSSMNNFILRSNLPAGKDPSQYAISVSSHPYFGRPDDEDSIVQGMLQIMVALCILAGYSITTASFAIYEVNEYHSGSKRLQHIAGVSEPLYWIANFLFDMVMYLIPVALTVGVIAVFQVPAFTDRQNLGAVTVLLILFGFSTFPWMYLLSSVFRDAEMAFIIYVCINLFLSVNTIIPTSTLYFMQQITFQNTESLKVIFDKLSDAFLIFPQFNFGNGLLALARKNIEVQLLSGYGIDAYKDPFSTEGLAWMMIASFIQGVVFFTLRLLWNKYIVRKVRRTIFRRKSVILVPTVDEDEDVATEHLRVSSGAASSDVLQVNQLTKVYQHFSKKVPAVKKLSLGVPAGECFGLLGVNGAGKTTTFKMLTGDVSPTDGTAQIRDRNGRLVDIMECRNQGINIGYCPQVDALDDLLSGEEHLHFYARLHGISKRDIPGVVNYLLRRVELNQYRDITADGYSCGTRRKLSTALALVGHPQILLLDEPSSGMDPRTKRQLWKIISEEVKGKCAVVLTSHSMEECEALCGRLAIMVKGQFRCLGSLQHIKNRFGSGFTVKIYMSKASSDVNAITRFMQSRFPSTYLKEQHSAMVEYHVPIAPGGVADIFGQLESSKEYLEIQHFSVSQTTLDEVFINFALEKVGMETIPIDDEFDDDTSMKDVDA